VAIIIYHYTRRPVQHASGSLPRAQLHNHVYEVLLQDSVYTKITNIGLFLTESFEKYRRGITVAFRSTVRILVSTVKYLPTLQHRSR